MSKSKEREGYFIDEGADSLEFGDGKLHLNEKEKAYKRALEKHLREGKNLEICLREEGL